MLENWGKLKKQRRIPHRVFFAKLLEKNYLEIAERKRGRFRWFLLTAFKGYLANEWDRESALKRGGKCRPISLDQISAEQRYHLEPSHRVSPDLVYEKKWALELILAARERLRNAFEAEGKSEKFALLEARLPGGNSSQSYAEIAKQLNSTEAAVKQSAHRLKTRYREMVREEVAKTVSDPNAVDEEIAYLMDVLSK